MGLYDGITRDGIVTFGSRGVVCVLTARELAVDEQIDIVAAQNKLRGQLEGKRIIKFRQNGADIVIALDYIHEIVKKFPPVTEEGEVDDNETEKSE